MEKMTQEEGFDYAKRNNLVEVQTTREDGFYKLFKQITRIKEITAIEKILLAVIMSYTDKGQEFFMSNNILARECGMCASNVSKKINDLREKGYVKTYKLIKKGDHHMIGRTIEPQKELISDLVKKNLNEYYYVEYKSNEDESRND